MSETLSIDEARSDLSRLPGASVIDVEAILGEVYLSFASVPATLRLSAVHWQLTQEGLLLASNLSHGRSKRFEAIIEEALHNRPVQTTYLHRSLALSIWFAHDLILSTLPLADRTRQARLGEVQWELEGPERFVWVSGWGKLMTSGLTEPIGEPDVEEGRIARELSAMTRLVEALRVLYGMKVVADGRQVPGPDIVGVDRQGERLAVELKLGTPREEHLRQLERYMADKRSPAYGARWILVADHEPAAHLRNLALRVGVEWLGLDELEMRANRTRSE